MMKPLVICMILLLTLSTTSCPSHQDDMIPSPPYERDGSTLLQMKSFIYLIGGTGDGGTRVLRKSASWENLEETEWVECNELPYPKAFGAVFTAGNRIYVVGGEDGEGNPTSTILHAYVFEDGTIGTWSSFGSRLPYPLSRMGYTFHDGRIFLFGGIGSDGIPTNTILHARIAPDTRVGSWYESNQTLHTPVEWTSALVVSTDEQPLIVVAGGTEATGKHSTHTTLFDLHPHGALTLHGHVMSPIGLSSPILAPTEDGFSLMGGIKEDGTINSTHHTYSFGTGGWESDQTGLPAIENHALTIEGTLCAVSGEGRRIGIFKGITAPTLPKSFPGSGLIPSDTTPIVFGEHGSTISQSEDGIHWEPIGSIDTSKLLYFKSESSDRISHCSSSEYTLVPYGFMVNLKGYLPIQDEESDPFTDIGTTDSTVWYGFGVSDSSRIELSWKDYTTHPLYYDGIVENSLREIDLYNEVLDGEGLPIRERTGASATPVYFTLPQGQYLIKLDFSTGSNAAIRLRRL